MAYKKLLFATEVTQGRNSGLSLGIKSINQNIMKQTKHYKNFRSIFFLLLVIMAACQKDAPLRKNGNIVFGTEISKANSGGRLQTDGTPVSLMISLRDVQTGTTVLSHHSLPLTIFGNSYVTPPLSIVEGAYELTEFIVLDGSNEAIYASPMDGSVKASLVANPLPIALTVVPGQTTTFTPEVVAINSDSTPQEFGILGFGFAIAPAASLRIEAATTGLINPSVRAFVVNTLNYQRQWVNLSIANDTAVAELRLDAGSYTVEIDYEVSYTGSASVSQKTLKAEKITIIDNVSTKQINFSSPASKPLEFTEWFKMSGPGCSFDLYISSASCNPSFKINTCNDLSEGYFLIAKDYFPNGYPGMGSSSGAELFIGNDISDNAIFDALGELDAPPAAFSSIDMQKKINTGIITGSLEMGSDDVSNCAQASANASGKINFSNLTSSYKASGQVNILMNQSLPLK